jgi:hypothetical protein
MEEYDLVIVGAGTYSPSRDYPGTIQVLTLLNRSLRNSSS